MKRTLTSIAAASMVLGLTVPAAFAATSHTNYNQRTISIGSYSAGLKGIAAKDPWSGANTEFMPIFYLQQGLKALGYTATWNGTTHTLAITTSSGSTTGLTKVTPGNGTVITVNGVPIVNAPKALVAKDPASGKWTSYLPIYYLADALKVLGYTSSYNGAAGTWTVKAAVGTLAITGAPSSDIGPGTKETFGLTNNGTAVTSGVTWSVSGTGAVIDQMGNFVASSAGTYTVTASYEGQTATASVVVYGQAVGYKVTSSASNLLADNTTYNTITVTAVDANGNPVGDYSGQAAVTDTAGWIAAATTAADQPSDFSNNDITFTNGVATFAVGPTITPNVTDTITVADTNATSPLASATYSLTSAQSTLSQLALAVKSGSSSAISANGQYSTTLALTAENAQGNTFSGQPGAYVTLNLTGPGSFSSGTTPVTTETVYVPSSGEYDVTVYSLPGQAGNISVSATSTGLSGASITVPTYINTAAGSLSVTSKTGTDPVTGNTYTLYTVQLLDTNGHPITTSAANDSFSLTDNASAGGGALNYGTLNSSGAFVTGSVPTQLTNGIAQFAVETTTVGTGTPTITVDDSTNSLTATAPYSYAAGAPYQLAVTPALGQQYTVKAGQTVTFSAQLEDKNGNDVAKAGVPVVFTLPTNTVSAQFPTGQLSYTVDTNANGVASVNFAIPSNTAGGHLAVTATDSSLNTPATTSESVDVLGATNTGDYATNVVLKNGTTTGAATVTSVSGTAGGSLSGTVDAIAQNAVGTPVTTADEYQITSSNTNVVSVTSADVASSGGVYNVISDLGALGTAGSSTITVKDISNPDAPSASFTVVVNPGSAMGAVVEYNGAAIGSGNQVSVSANTPVALEVVNADSAGDPIPLTGSAPETINLYTSGVSGAFVNSSGAPINSVTIQPGQSAVPVWFESATAETLNSGTQLTATESSGVATNGSVTTAGVAPVTAVKGTGTLVVSGTDTTAGTYSVSVNGTDTKTITTTGSDTTAQVAGLIAAAFSGDTTYTVAVDGTNSSQVDFTQITGTTGAVTPSMSTGTGAGLTGSGTSTLSGVTGSAGTKEVYTLNVTSSSAGNTTLSVTFNDGTINETVPVSVTNGESASNIASAIATALNADTNFSPAYTAAASSSSVVITANAAAANKTITMSVMG